MEENLRHEPHRISQLLILGSYTALAFGLVVEVLLMSWELWAIPLILAGVFAAWLVHLRQKMNGHQRLWIYTVLMMGTFFFYGIHVTSTYDMALLMMTVMIVYTVTGESALVTFGQVTYYITLAYNLVQMADAGAEWNSLLVSRTILHIMLIFMAGWLARFIIRQWDQIFRESENQIEVLDRGARRMIAFMANISHELRTPVNAILGISEVMSEQTSDPLFREDLATIRDAGNRIAAQVSDIMDYSELETDRVAVNSDTYELASLFNDIVSKLRPKLADGVELVIDVDADTPSALVSDAGKLRKILCHIIGNSLTYTREGGVYVHVSAVRQSYGINLCVEVTDTGIGMSEEEIEQVSQRFYQADSGKTVRTGGLGLGLPIAYGFVRALGGFMMIESKPDAGTTVRISIPQGVADEQRCMSVANRSQVQLGGYLNFEKFSHPYVREFYNSMILNVAQGLGTPLHRIGSLEDLRKLNAKLRLTHLFVGIQEYLSAPEYMELLARRMTVVVVSFDNSALPKGTGVHWIPKPLYGFPIAAILNSAGRLGEGASARTLWPGVRALVVDDEPMNLSVASGILRRYEMLVTTAASGPEAIRLCGETQFDIVFMDHMMPEMDGIETMKYIRRAAENAHQSFPIVALTANALSSAREMFLSEGFDGFVSKPIESAELDRVLKRVLPKALAVQAGPADSAHLRPSDPEGDDDPNAVPAPGGDMLRRLSSAGLNVDGGLHYCQDDISFYRDMLRQFEGDCADRRRQFEAYFAGRDLWNYAVLAHALKSNARTIGADALSERARRMEAAAKQGNAGYVAAHHEELMQSYATVADAIRGCCDGGVAPTASDDGALEFPPPNDVGPSPDGEEVLEFLPPDDEEPLEFEPEGAQPS